jgi:hypothetical protein
LESSLLSSQSEVKLIEEEYENQVNKRKQLLVCPFNLVSLTSLQEQDSVLNEKKALLESSNDAEAEVGNWFILIRLRD